MVVESVSVFLLVKTCFLPPDKTNMINRDSEPTGETGL